MNVQPWRDNVRYNIAIIVMVAVSMKVTDLVICISYCVSFLPVSICTESAEMPQDWSFLCWDKAGGVRVIC